MLRTAWMYKLADPMLLEQFTGRRYRLAQVLAANGVEAKGAAVPGAGHVAARWYDALERYNRRMFSSSRASCCCRCSRRQVGWRRRA